MIYFDNNATTQPFIESIHAFLGTPWYNPHAKYKAGSEADQVLEQARKTIAKCIDCEIGEVYFVSSPTEACNWAIQILLDKKCKINFSEFEHSAVVKPLLAKYNAEADFEREAYAQMLVNNVYGEVYTMPERKDPSDIIFCDGTAAIGHIPFSFKKSGIDMLAFGAHKFNGLRGAACLIIKKDLNPVKSLLWGGDITGGTPCPGLVAAMAVALEKNITNLKTNMIENMYMRDYLIDELLKIEGSHLNGPDKNHRAPNNVNISFDDVNGSELQEYLSSQSIYVSTGSACSSDSFVEKQGGTCPRPVNKDGVRDPELVTIFKSGNIDGDAYDRAKSSIRITLDANINTIEECKTVVEQIQAYCDFYR